MYPTRNII